MLWVQSMHAQAPGESGKVTHESQQPDSQRHGFSPGSRSRSLLLPSTGFLLSFSSLVSSGSWDSRVSPAASVLPRALASSQSDSVHPCQAWKRDLRVFGARLRARCRLRGQCQLGWFPLAIHKTPFTLQALFGVQSLTAPTVRGSANQQVFLCSAGCLLLIQRKGQQTPMARKLD